MRLETIEDIELRRKRSRENLPVSIYIHKSNEDGTKTYFTLKVVDATAEEVCEKIKSMVEHYGRGVKNGNRRIKEKG
jgi:hypothetical protein